MTNLVKLKEDYVRNEKIKDRLDSGKTLREIADEFGVSIGLPDYLKKNYEEVQNNLKSKIETYENVIKLFKEGYTITQIADLEDTTKQNISRILKMGNVDRKSGGKSKKKKDNIKNMKELNDKGFTLEEIAEKLGLEEMKVRQYAYEVDLELTSNTEVRVAKLSDDILKLRDDGFSQKDIAEKLNISQAYVSKILLNEDMRVRLSREEYEERDRKVYRDFAAGMKVKDIAEKHDLGEINVRRILYKFTKADDSKVQ